MALTSNQDNPSADGGRASHEIKDEPISYLDYNRIKKEEPIDEPLDRSLPVLEEQNDMFADVDGPEYVDQNYEGIAEVDGVDYFICEEFKIRQVPKPVIITRPLYQLFDCILSEHIILDPEYQREVTWDEGRSALLINSILMGYFIPPIIFNVVQRLADSEDGTQRLQHKRICVDGKQRLTSIWKFMTGQIGFFDSNTPQRKWYFCHPAAGTPDANTTRNILPNSVKEFFKNQAFCCYEYEELTQDTEETMFQLVQKGIAMTPGEKMRAMSTEWATLSKQFEDEYPMVLNLSKQQRGSGFRLVLTIFAMIQEVTGQSKKRVTTQAGPTLQASQPILMRILENKEPIDTNLKKQFKAIFEKFDTLVKMSSTELTNSRWRINRDSAFDPTPIWLREKDTDHGKSFSPIELIGTAILITIHMDTHSDEELLEDIMCLRHYLRSKNYDLRVNTQCWRVVWEFVSIEIEKRRSGKASVPAFLNNHTARIWAKKREAEDKAEIVRKAALMKAKAARAKERAARARELAAQQLEIRSESVSKASSKSNSKERSLSEATRKSRSPSERPEVFFPNLSSKAMKSSSRTLADDENDSSSLSDLDLDYVDDDLIGDDDHSDDEEDIPLDVRVGRRAGISASSTPINNSGFPRKSNVEAINKSEHSGRSENVESMRFPSPQAHDSPKMCKRYSSVESKFSAVKRTKLNP